MSITKILNPLTDQECLKMIIDCWETYGQIAFPMLTRSESSQVEGLLIDFEEQGE
jgi:hypothetical protein